MKLKKHTKVSILDVVSKVVLLLGALVVVQALVVSIVNSFSGSEENVEVSESDVSEVESVDDASVEDTAVKVQYPPHYLQIDERWKDLPYSKETVETYGCGLTCAASYICWVTQDPSYTVETLYNAVGNSCLTDNVNDMSKFGAYISEHYDVAVSDQQWENDVAKKALLNGDMMFASMSGELIPGHKSYGGHIVLIYKWDDKGIWVMDPDDPDSETPISEQRFDEVFGNDHYFYLLHVNSSNL